MDGFGPLLEALMTFEPALHVFGGFAEDALLHGTSVRTHDDVDVLVGREELEVQLGNARAIGFSSHEVRFEPIEGMPMVIGTTDGNLDLEISVYDRTPEGIVCFQIPDREGRLFRVDLSEGAFDYPVSDLDGIACARYRRWPCIRSARGSRWWEVSDRLVRKTSPRRRRFAPGSSPTLRPSASNRG
jgi:hypothetical protein